MNFELRQKELERVREAVDQQQEPCLQTDCRKRSQTAQAQIGRLTEKASADLGRSVRIQSSR